MSPGKAVVVCAAIVLAILVPSAFGAHGCPYRLIGTAARDDLAVPLPAELRWSGGGIHCPVGDSTFTVIIGASDPLHPNVIVAIESKNFAGEEDISHTTLEECVETVDPYYGWSTDPGVKFNVSGTQTHNFCTLTDNMTYSGIYENYWLAFNWTY